MGRPTRTVRVGLLAAALALVALPGTALAADDGGRIEARYQALGGEAGVLGPPTSEAYDTGADGRARDYTAGRIYWSPATDAWEVVAPVLDRYLALSGPDGHLGLPTAPATGLPTADGALEQAFTGGRVYASAATGARAVAGGILKRYLAIGASGSYLGFPTSDTTASGDGFASRFQRGRITWSSTSGSTRVTGRWAPEVRRVTAEEIPYTYRPGCPVGPTALRLVRVPYYDWRGVPRHGSLVARTSAVADLKRVFRKAFADRFPIRRMNPVDVYRGSDIRAMAADNTSAFNCRKVTGNPYRLSQHSYGNAIDINTVENPYVTSSRVYPRSGRTFLDRSRPRKGMILRRSSVARMMSKQGWRWGARWAHPDYQHFSSNGG